MRRLLVKTCFLLPVIAVAGGAGAAEITPSTDYAPADKAKSRVPGGHTAVAPESVHAPNKHGNAHWTYKGTTGPSHWGAMKPNYAACKDGLMQSPIDIHGGLSVKPQAIRFEYKISPLAILNNGHTVQVNYGKGSRIEIGDKTFDLLQFHFNTPNEHMIAGQRFPMEMHLVHKASDGSLAVIGVMIKPGKQNLALGEIWPHLPRTAGNPSTNVC